jgi:hypothetical protein
MPMQLRSRPLPRRALISALLALAVPFCLLAGTATTTVAAPNTCQPEAVTANFCTKATYSGDAPAIVPGALVLGDDGGLTPQPLCTLDTFTHPLPGYVTTPSGRSPPRF